MFLGRKNELDTLNRIYRLGGFQLFVLYGRQGIGKTTLLQEFCKGKDAIFFTAQDKSSRANLENFSKLIIQHYEEANEPFSFWDNAFNFIAEQQRFSRLVLVIDNLSGLVERDMKFFSILQHAIINEFRDSKIFLILSSSDIAFMKNYVLSAEKTLKVSGSMLIDSYLTEEAVNELRENLIKTSDTPQKPRMQKFSADEVITRQGETYDDIFRIVSGRAVCYLNYGTDDEYLLGSLKEDNTCGEYSLLMNDPEIYTVVAFTDVLVMRVGREDFEKFTVMNVNNSVGIIRQLARMMKVMKVHIDMLNAEKQ